MTSPRQSPKRRAVALHYRHDLPAPMVIAKGSGRVAERLIEIAHDHSIAIVNRPELLDTLVMLELGDYIPEELYRMIAELLAFVRQVDSRKHDGADS